jgi:hypothetical protein
VTSVKLLSIVALSFLVFTLVLGCVGCGAAYVPGPGQPFPSIFSTSTGPGIMTVNEEYLAHPERFEVIGETSGSSSNTTFLGLITFGDAGYQKARERAIRNAGADGLINCTADIHSSSLLFLFAGSRTTVTGLAIKRK